MKQLEDLLPDLVTRDVEPIYGIVNKDGGMFHSKKGAFYESKGLGHSWTPFLFKTKTSLVCLKQQLLFM